MTNQTTPQLPDLKTYDVILLNTSGGKDSQAMIDLVYEMAVAAGCTDKLQAVHCDLGRCEWQGTMELAIEQCEHYNISCTVVSRPQGDLLDHVELRGMWPSSTARYCTSDHKRGQVDKLLTAIAKDFRVDNVDGRAVRILNCMGLRADESSARAKKNPLQFDKRASNGRRTVDQWLPIFDWNTKQVWERINTSGVRHHEAYDLGMSRLSCVFCVFANKSDLEIAGRANPELLNTYADLELKINHTFKHGWAINDLRNRLNSETKTNNLVALSVNGKSLVA